jgi:hypothetical protein
MAATYEFRVRGHLGPMLLQAFADLDAETQGRFTLLRGIVGDQAALHGVLARLEALGLELIDMRQLTDEGQRRP